MEDELSSWLSKLSQAGRSNSSINTKTETNSEAASDAFVTEAIVNLHRICCEDSVRSNFVPRVLPSLNRTFQRIISQPQIQPSNSLLILEILRFYLDFGDDVLHDSDKSLNTFFRLCLKNHYNETSVVKKTLQFFKNEKEKFLTRHPHLLPLYFPLLLKMFAWGNSEMDDDFFELLPLIISSESLLSLFPFILNFPMIVLALEKKNTNEKTNNGFFGHDPSHTQMDPSIDVLALMDDKFTGISKTGKKGEIFEEDEEEEEGSDYETSLNAYTSLNAFFSDVNKEEMEGIMKNHWNDNEEMLSALSIMIQSSSSLTSSSPSNHLIHAIDATPKLLKTYFSFVLRDISYEDSASLLQIIFDHIEYNFPNSQLCNKLLSINLDAILFLFKKNISLVKVLKKPIMEIISVPFASPSKAELALHLCWIIGEYRSVHSHPATSSYPYDMPSIPPNLCYDFLTSKNAQSPSLSFSSSSLPTLPSPLASPSFSSLSPSPSTSPSPSSSNDVANELFECLELILYENLSACKKKWSSADCTPSDLDHQPINRLLCYLTSSLSKLAFNHTSLNPRAHVCLAKVLRSDKYVGQSVLENAQECMGWLHSPLLSTYISNKNNHPFSNTLSSHLSSSHLSSSFQSFLPLPFQLLHEIEKPFHEFSYEDIF